MPDCKDLLNCDYKRTRVYLLIYSVKLVSLVDGVLFSWMIRMLWWFWRRRPSEKTPWPTSSPAPDWSWRWETTFTARTGCRPPLTSMVWSHMAEELWVCVPLDPGTGKPDDLCVCVCFAEIKTTVVCPATEKHVKKYQRQESFLVEESGTDYESITLPYIQRQSFSVQVSLLRSSFPVFTFKCAALTVFATASVGVQHPGEEGRGREDHLWRSGPGGRLRPPPGFQMGPKTGERPQEKQTALSLLVTFFFCFLFLFYSDHHEPQLLSGVHTKYKNTNKTWYQLIHLKINNCDIKISSIYILLVWY